MDPLVLEPGSGELLSLHQSMFESKPGTRLSEGGTEPGFAFELDYVFVGNGRSYNSQTKEYICINAHQIVLCRESFGYL